jgi:hypothetical protein
MATSSTGNRRPNFAWSRKGSVQRDQLVRSGSSRHVGRIFHCSLHSIQFNLFMPKSSYRSLLYVFNRSFPYRSCTFPMMMTDCSRLGRGWRRHGYATVGIGGESTSWLIERVNVDRIKRLTRLGI